MRASAVFLHLYVHMSHVHRKHTHTHTHTHTHILTNFYLHTRVALVGAEGSGRAEGRETRGGVDTGARAAGRRRAPAGCAVEDHLVSVQLKSNIIMCPRACICVSERACMRCHRYTYLCFASCACVFSSVFFACLLITLY